MAIFPTSFLGNIGLENLFYDILERKNAFLGNKIRSSKSPKLDIFPKGLTHGFWSKNGHFSDFFFLRNIGQEDVFYDILERRNAFLGYKTRNLKSPKIGIFSKGLTHSFGPKMAIFPTFFFR